MVALGPKYLLCIGVVQFRVRSKSKSMESRCSIVMFVDTPMFKLRFSEGPCS